MSMLRLTAAIRISAAMLLLLGSPLLTIAQEPTAPDSIANDLYGDEIPRRAAVRPGTEWFRIVECWRNGIMFSHDGKTVVSCSRLLMTIKRRRSTSFWSETQPATPGIRGASMSGRMGN